MPISAFRNGDYSSLLGAQLGTDALGRPIFTGQLYDPFSTRQLPGGSFIRDPIPGNNLATYVSPYTGGTLINSIGQTLINYYPTPSSALSNNWSATGLQADYSDEYSDRIDHNFSDRTRLWAPKPESAHRAGPEPWSAG